MKLSIHSIITNQYVLYLISLLSLLQLFTYIYRNQLDSIIVYMLIAYVVFTFTRNMILILGTPLLILRFTNLFTIEGFEEEEVDEGEEEKVANNNKEVKPDKNSKTDKKKSSSKSLSPNTEPILPEYSDSTMPVVESANEDTEHTDQSNLESIDNLNPADFETVPVKNRHPTKKSKEPKNRINYASNYMANLKKYNNLLGSDGIYKMTEHTKDLMKQQNQLGESIAKIVPLIQQMTPFLKSAGNLFNGNNNMENE